MNYYQINFDISPRNPWTEILIQELAEIDFDSFTEENNQLQAYVQEEYFNEDKLKELITQYNSQEVEIHFTKEFIPSQNWNATWEADYKPVEIDDLLLIRAPFHPEDSRFKKSIEIQPQMSFGTGHHQTTYLLCKTILDMNFDGLKVLDVGTGTGVLGILASILGAKQVFGTDIEEGAVENAIENCQRNNVTNFEVIKGDIDVVPKKKYDVIFANINMNVLLGHLSDYAELIKKDGILMMSGFFETDVSTLLEAAEQNNFIKKNVFTLEGWAVLILKKN